MSHARTPGSGIANGSLASLPSRRRLAPGGLEDDGSIGCADVSTARGIRDRSLLPVLRPRSSSDRRPARPQGSARPAREPNLYFSACSRLSAEAQIKPTSTESEADPMILRASIVLAFFGQPSALPETPGLKLVDRLPPLGIASSTRGTGRQPHVLQVSSTTLRDLQPSDRTRT